MSNTHWKYYVNDAGDFELPTYLFRSINDLMKYTLDLGTLLSDDQKKLRAYREQVKKTFKKKWYDIASALEFFEIITPCGCDDDDYCETCGGSRYTLNILLSPDEMQEIGLVVGAADQADISDRLHKGLMKALREIDAMSDV